MAATGREGDGFGHPRGLREVIPNQTRFRKHKEFVVPTGGRLSTLQEIKLPDTAGGYVYSNPEGSPSLANRTLYWRTIGDILELCEISLNFNLSGNKVRYRFQDSPLLDGVSVHESWGQVVILVPTVTSVHRLSFPHPTRLEKSDLARTEDGGLMSILSEASVATAREYQHLLSWASASPLPNIAATYFTHDEESVFVLGNNQGELTCVKMGQVRGMTSVKQLSSARNYLGMVWTSLTRSADIRDQPQSFIITPLIKDKSEEVLVCVFLCFQQHSQFLLLGLLQRAGQLDINPRGTLYCPEHDLVGFSPTSQGIAAVWTTSEGETIVRRSTVGVSSGWENVVLAESEPGVEELELENEDEDPRQLYLGALFSPGVFRAATLARTVGIFRRNLENSNIDEGTTWEQLKQEVVSAVEADIQNSLTDYETRIICQYLVVAGAGSTQVQHNIEL
ncbi:nuclear pore complex protein Nup160 [Eurytemora carolleeae]|uniref:nuclear pore complex protein Nup160 n=1 Tax=Eurytemora carolleeae TaxID=1294199 RepID=UPI000C757C74|nr:nuclear pore complex protein Nup160 [Eurytemora carolleeae]|eukprot:XP_023326535.1 nuclear pore complex protein Nup160-like [Eurytemora affinis]